MANLEVVSNLAAGLVLLLLTVLKKYSEIAVYGLQNSYVEGVLRDIGDFDGVDGLEDDLLGLHCHVDGEVVDFNIPLGDVEDGLGMDVFENLSLLVDADRDSVDEVSIFDSHDLIFEVHEDDVLGVVLNAQLTLDVVHDIVDPIKFPCANLLSFEVDFETPEDEALLVLFGFFEEDIDDVVDRGRDGQQLLLLTYGIILLQFLLNRIEVFDVVDLIACVIEESQEHVL